MRKNIAFCSALALSACRHVSPDRPQNGNSIRHESLSTSKDVQPTAENESTHAQSDLTSNGQSEQIKRVEYIDSDVRKNHLVLYFLLDDKQEKCHFPKPLNKYIVALVPKNAEKYSIQDHFGITVDVAVFNRYSETGAESDSAKSGWILVSNISKEKITGELQIRFGDKSDSFISGVFKATHCEAMAY